MRKCSLCPAVLSCSPDTACAVPGAGGEAGSPSNVSKVGPMVAGHAISRPRYGCNLYDCSIPPFLRIQLTRQDEAAMVAARERQAADLGLLPAQGGDHQVRRLEPSRLASSHSHPAPPSRTRMMISRSCPPPRSIQEDLDSI